jgi:hypothetical protein
MNDLSTYDANNVFDDVLPTQPVVSQDAQVAAVRAILRQAQRLRLPPPELTVTPVVGGDVGEIEDRNALDEVLGAELEVTPGKAVPFASANSLDYPITQGLYKKFQAATPAPKIIRVDTETTYVLFLDSKRKPYLDDLEDKLSSMDDAVTPKSDIDPGADDVPDAALETIGADIERAKERAAVCGDVIPLSLPPDAQGKINAWQDGEQIYCSMKLPAPDGSVRIATTSSPVSRHIDEAATYAAAADIDPMVIMGVLPALAQVLGGGALVTQLARATPALLSQPAVVSGAAAVTAKVVPSVDLAVAAVMALLQACKNGNQQACTEMKKLNSTKAGQKLITSATKSLSKATKGGV